MFALNNKEKSLNKSKVISPRITKSPFNIPDCPQYLNIYNINKMNNLQLLKKLEYEYDQFLNKKCQILLLLNVIEDVFEIRDSLILRINYLERQYRMRKIRLEYN